MSEKYLIEYKNGVTRIQFFKNPTYAETQTIINDLSENYPYEKRLWILTNVRLNFTRDEIRAIAKYGKIKFIKPNRLALVAPDNWTYIKLHMFQAHRKQKEHSVAKVFRTELKALEWLINHDRIDS